jgi:hypothetical protein
MKPRHVAALVFGCLLLLLGLGMVVGGGGIGVFELAARGDGGWHTVDITRLESSGVAVTSKDAIVVIHAPDSVIDRLDMQMRLRVTPAHSSEPAFVGVGPSADVAAYLAGSAYDQVTRLSVNGVPTYRHLPGAATVEPPAQQTFWDASFTGPSKRELTWTLRSGSWTAAVLNASGSSGVSVSAVAGVRMGPLLPIGVAILVVGLLIAAVGTALVVAAVRGARHPAKRSAAGIPAGDHAGTSGVPSPAMASIGILPSPDRPLVLEARLAPDLSRWLWLVKWFLAIPHYVVLTFLWLAFGVTTICAWFAILFTARYPRSLFDFNVGVLRWTWRVGYYMGWGGLGTDRYPPFTLAALPGDDARLDVAYPERLSRGLIFVKWLLLLPHWIVIALLAGTQSRIDEHGAVVGGWPGVLSLLAFVAGIVLLVSGTYAVGLFEVLVGLNRWVFRVLAYAALMTDVYPPFRYDGGGRETPHHGPTGPVGPPVAAPEPADVTEPVARPEWVAAPQPADVNEPRFDAVDADKPAPERSTPELWHHPPGS